MSFSICEIPAGSDTSDFANYVSDLKFTKSDFQALAEDSSIPDDVKPCPLAIISRGRFTFIIG